MIALVSGQRSTLNPNAPPFVPAVYREVEDFSPEWWELVKSSAWFRDYWLSLHAVVEDLDGGVEDLFPESLDVEAQFEEMVMMAEAEEEFESDEFAAVDSHKSNAPSLRDLKMEAKTLLKDLSMLKSPKQRSPKSPVECAKYQMKAAQYANPKSSPRRINQPR